MMTKNESFIKIIAISIFCLFLIVFVGTFTISVSASDTCDQYGHRWLADGTCDVCGVTCQHYELVTYADDNIPNNTHITYVLCDMCRLEWTYSAEACVFENNICKLCGASEHVSHTFDQKVATATYKKSNATCSLASEYYYSCLCGQKGSSTFYSGSPAGHRWLTDGSCDVCGVECNHTFDANNNCSICGVHQHVYDQKVASATYKKANATCSLASEYYYSCACGQKGSLTFYSGSPAGHRWLTDGTCDVCGVECSHSFNSENNCTICGYHKHIYDQKVATANYKKTDATCTSAPTYYFSCLCGEKGTSSFSSGSPAGHRFLTDGSCQNCSAQCSHSYVGTNCTICNHHKHIYDQKNSDIKYKAFDATCTSAPGFYYSCNCGLSGSSATFLSGSALGHRWLTDGTCDVCGVECSHSFNSEHNCTICGYHKHIYDQKVATSSYKKTDATCTAAPVYYFSCVCGLKTTSTFSSGTPLGHRWATDGTCVSCGLECSHTFKDTRCTICNYHRHIYNLMHNYSEDPESCCYYICSEEGCGYVYNHLNKDYSYPHIPSVNYIQRVPYIVHWNSNLSNVQFENFTGLDKFPYQRFTIASYSSSCDYKGTVNMSNGLIKCDTRINASKYLVFRMRKSDISLVELNIFGGSDVDDVSAAGGFKNYYFRFDVFPDNEWFTAVFDLSKTSAFYSVSGNTSGYVVDEEINRLSLRFCSKFESVDGYVDFEYFALCDDLDDVKRLIHSNNYYSSDEKFSFLLCESSQPTLSYAEHIFDQQVPTATYKKADSTCTQRATYYYSCVCDVKGTSTFYSGSPSGHVWLTDCTCDVCGTERDHLLDENLNCEYCGTHIHVFDQEVASASFKEKNATCTESPTYFISCICKEKGTSTFSSGSPLGHRWLTDGTCDVCGSECSHTMIDSVCIDCGYHKHVYDSVDGKCTLCGMSCVHDYDYYFEYDETYHVPWQKCLKCSFTSYRDGVFTPEEHSSSPDKNYCEICGYKLGSSVPSDSIEDETSHLECECLDIQFARYEYQDDEYHNQIGVCTSCSKEYVLVFQKHEFDSDGICTACGYDLSESETETSDELEDESDSDSNSGSKDKSDNDEDEFNPFLLIPVVALVGAVAIVIVLIARKRRRVR